MPPGLLCDRDRRQSLEGPLTCTPTAGRAPEKPLSFPPLEGASLMDQIIFFFIVGTHVIIECFPVGTEEVPKVSLDLLTSPPPPPGETVQEETMSVE